MVFTSLLSAERGETFIGRGRARRSVATGVVGMSAMACASRCTVPAHESWGAAVRDDDPPVVDLGRAACLESEGDRLGGVDRDANDRVASLRTVIARERPGPVRRKLIGS